MKQIDKQEIDKRRATDEKNIDNSHFYIILLFTNFLFGYSSSKIRYIGKYY